MLNFTPGLTNHNNFTLNAHKSIISKCVDNLVDLKFCHHTGKKLSAASISFMNKDSGILFLTYLFRDPKQIAIELPNSYKETLRHYNNLKFGSVIYFAFLNNQVNSRIIFDLGSSATTKLQSTFRKNLLRDAKRANSINEAISIISNTTAPYKVAE